MRTTPLLDTLDFLVGNTPDHMALGPARWLMVVLFAALMLGSVALAAHNLSRDPAQRDLRTGLIWLFRLTIGAMWFQGSLWKLPLPVSGGFEYWTGQLAQHSAFAWHASLVRDVLLPNIALLDPAVWLTETFLAIALMLGIAVRLAGVVGALFMLNLWIGLYRNDAEWPWNYVFLAILMLMFTLDRAGRSLGLDAVIARQNRPGLPWRVLRILG